VRKKLKIRANRTGQTFLPNMHAKKGPTTLNAERGSKKKGKILRVTRRENWVG